jgi:hypothetical protein
MPLLFIILCLQTSTATMLANTVTTCQIYKGDKSVITGSTHVYSHHVGQHSYNLSNIQGR